MSRLSLCEPIKPKCGSQQTKSKPVEFDGFKMTAIKHREKRVTYHGTSPVAFEREP